MGGSEHSMFNAAGGKVREVDNNGVNARLSDDVGIEGDGDGGSVHSIVGDSNGEDRELWDVAAESLLLKVLGPLSWKMTESSFLVITTFLVLHLNGSKKSFARFHSGSAALALWFSELVQLPLLLQLFMPRVWRHQLKLCRAHPLPLFLL
jgi:hypothetical protein